MHRMKRRTPAHAGNRRAEDAARPEPRRRPAPAARQDSRPPAAEPGATRLSAITLTGSRGGFRLLK
jgi:hypothetical protein